MSSFPESGRKSLSIRVLPFAALLLLILLASGCEIPFSMPTSVNLHRTVPCLEDKHVKVGGQLGSHLSLAGDIGIEGGRIVCQGPEEYDFQTGGADTFCLYQISKDVDVCFSYDSSEEGAWSSLPLADETESKRISRGYHLSSQIVIMRPDPSEFVTVVPEFAYYTTDYTLGNISNEQADESYGEGIWFRLPILFGLKTTDGSSIGSSLMTGPDFIYADYDVSTRLVSFSGEEISRSSQHFSHLFVGWHLLAAVHLYFVETYLEGWFFFPEHLSFRPVPGLSVGMSIAF